MGYLLMARAEIIRKGGVARWGLGSCAVLHILALTVTLGGSPGVVRGDDGPSLTDLRAKLLNRLEKRIEAEGRMKGLSRLEQLLGTETPSETTATPKDFIAQPKLWDEIASAIRQKTEGRDEKLGLLDENLTKLRDEAKAAWKVVARDTEALASTPGPEPPSLVRGIMIGLLPTLALGVLAILAMRVLVLLETRRSRRSWLRSLKGAGSLLIACGIALQAASGCSPTVDSEDETASDASENEARLKQQVRDTEAAISDLSKRGDRQDQNLREQEEKILAGRLREILPVGEPANSNASKEIQSAERKGQELVHGLVVKAGQAAAFAEDGLKRRIEQKERLASIQAASASDRLQRQVLGSLNLGLGLVLLACVVIPIRKARQKTAEEVKLSSEQCPRCLDRNLGTVETEVFNIHGQPLLRMECRNNQCVYDFDARYRDYPRICLPTLGIKESGKTRWLLSVYEKVVNGNLPLPGTMESLPSRYDPVFVGMIREYLEENQVMQPTVVEMPSPVIVYTKDRDRLGRSEVLVNLFDYSGEAMFMKLEDIKAMRRRALLSDSYVLFMDPTQVLSGGDYTINDQIRGFNEFCSDVRILRGLKQGQPIDMAVAVCIPKIDLLVDANRSPFAGMAEEWLEFLRKSADVPISLSLINKRSKYCEKVLKAMFPGLDLKKRLEMNFAARYKFFPISSVGIEPEGLGSGSSVAIRSPFGVMEPLYWLLHMHGYCVFGGLKD